MTDVLTPPAARRSPRGGSRGASTAPTPGGLWAAAGAAGMAAVLPLLAIELVTLLAWATDPNAVAGVHPALRVGAAVWLLSQKVPLALPGGHLSVPPLGLAVAPVWLLARSARTLTHKASRAAPVVAVMVGCYTGAVVAVAVLARGAQLRPSLPAAAAAGLVISAGAVMLGAYTGPAGASLRRRVPNWVWPVGAGGMAAAGAVLGVAALAAATALVVHWGSAVGVARLVHAGPVGGGALALLGVAFAPVLALYAAALLTGPGFALGSGTVVNVLRAHVGALPALPAFAALPGDGRFGWPVLLLPAAVVVAGAVGGVVASRRGAPTARLRDTLTVAGSIGAAGAALLSTGWVIAAGAAGPGRLGAVGPLLVADAGSALLELALGAAAALLVIRSRAGSPTGSAARTRTAARRGTRSLPR